MLTMYSKPNCPHCDGAEIYLSQHGIAYHKIDVTKNAEALGFLKGQGHKTVPQFYKDGKLFVEGGFSGLRSIAVEKLVQA